MSRQKNSLYTIGGIFLLVTSSYGCMVLLNESGATTGYMISHTHAEESTHENAGCSIVYDTITTPSGVSFSEPREACSETEQKIETSVSLTDQDKQRIQEKIEQFDSKVSEKIHSNILSLYDRLGSLVQARVSELQILKTEVWKPELVARYEKKIQLFEAFQTGVQEKILAYTDTIEKELVLQKQAEALAEQQRIQAEREKELQKQAEEAAVKKQAQALVAKKVAEQVAVQKAQDELDAQKAAEEAAAIKAAEEAAAEKAAQELAVQKAKEEVARKAAEQATALKAAQEAAARKKASTRTRAS